MLLQGDGARFEEPREPVDTPEGCDDLRRARADVEVARIAPLRPLRDGLSQHRAGMAGGGAELAGGGASTEGRVGNVRFFFAGRAISALRCRCGARVAWGTVRRGTMNNSRAAAVGCATCVAFLCNQCCHSRIPAQRCAAEQPFLLRWTVINF